MTEGAERIAAGFHSKSGRLLLVFGSIDLVRLIRELFEVWHDAYITFLRIIALDLLLALLTMAAGLGMMRRTPWAPLLALSVAAASIVPTLAFGIFLLPEFLNHLGRWFSGGESYYLRLLLPRMIFEAIKLAFWPYAFLLLRRELMSEPASRRRGWNWMALSLLLSGALVGTIFLLH
jgi:hypothetical protein